MFEQYGIATLHHTDGTTETFPIGCIRWHGDCFSLFPRSARTFDTDELGFSEPIEVMTLTRCMKPGEFMTYER